MMSGSGKWTPRSLEDLYTHFPFDDGNHTYKLRVRRTAPQRVMGMYVAGDLCDLTERITMDQFKDRFGGERFEVLVLGPPAGKDMVPGVDFETKATLNLLVPGVPNLSSLPMTDDVQEIPMASPQRVGYGAQRFVPAFGQEDPAVSMKRMELEEAQRVRADQERRDLANRVVEHARTPDSVIKAATQQAERTVDLLREQSAVLQKRVGELETELALSRQAVVKAEGEAARNLHINETERTRAIEVRYQEQAAQLKESHSRELAEARDRHGKEVVDLKDRHQKEVTDIKDRAAKDLAETHQRHRDELEQKRVMYQDRGDQMTREYQAKITEKDGDRVRYEADAARERERLREEMQRREIALKDAHTMQLENVKQTYEARIHDLERSSQREIAAVREQRDREVSAAKETYASQERFSKETTQFKIQGNEQEMLRLREEIRKLERECEALRLQVHKPFHQALAEVKETASLLGLEERSEEEDKPAEGPFDWKQQLAQLVQTAVKSAPEMLDKLTTMRAQGAQHAAAHAAVAQQRAPMPNQPPPMVRRRPAPPPSLAGGGPPPMSARPPAPFQPSIGLPPQYMGPPPPPSPMGIQAMPNSVILQEQRATSAIPPAGGTETVFRTVPSPLNEPTRPLTATPPPAGWLDPPSAASSAPASVPPPAPAPSRATGAPPAPAGDQDFSLDAIAGFVGHLDQAIQAGFVTPRQFAEAFVAEIGAERTVQIIQGMSADHFIALTNSHPEGQKSAIVTRQGQKFVRLVWEEAHNVATGVPAQQAS
jgi:hypothetical protein